MQKQQKEFVKGLFPKFKNPKAPDFVLWRGSIKLKDMLEFCQAKIAQGEEWANYDVLRPKDETKNPYAVVNDWKPENKPQFKNDNNSIDVESIPF